MASQIQLRRGTLAEWAAANPVLLLGELGFVTDAALLGLHKVGNGSTAWNSLKWAYRSARVTEKVLSSAGYTVLDNDGYETISVTTGASDRTIALPTLADNLGREIEVSKIDSGAGEIILDGEGAELILWPGGSATTCRVGLINQYCRVRGMAAGWQIVGGVVQPVALEPSLGTPHEANRTLTGFDLNGLTDLTSAPHIWDLAALGLPVGAKRAEIYLVGYKSTTLENAADEVIAWDYDAGATGFNNSYKVGFSLRVGHKAASGAAQIQQASWRGFIRIGASRKLYTGTLYNNVSLYANYLGYDS